MVRIERRERAKDERKALIRLEVTLNTHQQIQDYYASTDLSIRADRLRDRMDASMLAALEAQEEAERLAHIRLDAEQASEYRKHRRSVGPYCWTIGAALFGAFFFGTHYPGTATGSNDATSSPPSPLPKTPTSYYVVDIKTTIASGAIKTEKMRLAGPFSKSNPECDDAVIVAESFVHHSVAHDISCVELTKQETASFPQAVFPERASSR